MMFLIFEKVWRKSIRINNALNNNSQAQQLENLKNFKSPMSKEVKLISFLGSFVLLFIGLSFILTQSSIHFKALILLSLLILFMILFSKSLYNIKLKKDHLILHFRLGQKRIYFKNIERIAPIHFDNLTMTMGTKGCFGFNGNLMNDTKASVNDRKNMIGIYTKKENYLFSVKHPQKFMVELKKKLK